MANHSDASDRVVVTDVDLPFGRRVQIVFLWMFAAIPALVVAAFMIGFVVSLVRIAMAG
jgi:hypothetical protein